MADENQGINAEPAQNPNGQAAEQADDPTELTFDQWQEKAKGTGVLRGRLAVVGKDGYDIKLASTPEFKTHLERKLLEASFTETTIQAAVSSTTPGFLLGLSTDASWRKELSSSTSSAEDVTLMHYSHIFPRATMHLGTRDLEISDECLEFLKEARIDVEQGRIDTALKSFEEEFEVTLGGRRFEVKKVREHNESRTAEQNVGKKVSGGIEGSSMAAGGKFGFGRDKGQTSSIQNDSSAGKRGRGLRVIGGDERRFENVEEWAATIARSNWKAIEHDNVVSLLNHLKWVIARDDKQGNLSGLVGRMWEHSEMLQKRALAELVFQIRITLRSTTINKKKWFQRRERKVRNFTIDPVDPDTIEWIYVKIPDAGIKEDVYEPQLKESAIRHLTKEEKKRRPIEIEVKGLDPYQVFLVLQLKRHRWKSPPPDGKDPLPDPGRYPLNWILPLLDADEETNRDLEYGYRF
ncbi:hypothetical protein ACEPPN_013210 [Leptodophora sp. 'Broadleaf-Isolate-01']